MSALSDLDEALAYRSPLISARSQLFSLAPSGVGTPYQESLISLLVRTSRAHSVSPRRLIAEVFGRDPIVSKLAYGKFHRDLAGTMNGLGRYAEIFVSAMEKLTAQNRLSHLTMLPWKDFFPFNGQGLLSRNPKWCPACLHQQYFAGVDTVFPLAWSIEPYRVCPEHHLFLEESCPSCGKTQPFIPHFPDLGICEYCHSNLADIRPREYPSSFQLWIASAIGDMIMRQSDPVFMPSLDRFRDFIKLQVQVLAGRNRAVFCRAIGIHDRALNGWLSKGERPAFSQFLTLSYGMNILPRDIFLDSTQPTALRPLPDSVKYRKPNPKLTVQRKNELEQVLKWYVDRQQAMSVAEIARSIGLTPGSLKYWFPDICATLSMQHQVSVKTRSESRLTQQRHRTEEVVAMLLAEGQYPSRRQINYVLQRESMSLAQSHVYQAYQNVLHKNFRRFL